MSAAADAKGLKRVCVGCGSRFYDFNKRPIKCPKCSTEFSGEIKLKGRRGRAAVIDSPIEEEKIKSPAANDVEADDIAPEEDVVSLDEVEDLENADSDDDEDAIDLDEDLGDLDELEEIEEDEVLEDEDGKKK